VTFYEGRVLKDSANTHEAVQPTRVGPPDSERRSGVTATRAPRGR
jgi:hypothetical protein